MKLDVTVFVRRLHGGQVLVRVAAEPDTCVFAEEESEALLDLTLLLVDRLERTHPRLLHRLASSDNAELASYVLGDALPVHTELALARRPMRVSCIVSRHKQYDRLWFPAWDLRHWIAARAAGKDQATQNLATDFLAEYLPRLDAGALLERRVERDDELQVISLEVSPPPLAAFTGRYLGADLLPEPRQQEEDDEVEKEKTKRPLPTPMLDTVALDLTERARRGELGRAVQLDTLVDRLERELDSGGGALVLVGSPGSGKTVAVHELAHRLVARNRSRPKERPRRLWHADATRLIALRSMFGDWRGQTLGVIDEIAATGDVWYLGSILALIDAGKSISSRENVAQILRPHLARRKLRVIGEATTEEWARLELRDPAFARAFTPVRLDEPDEARSLAILRGVAALRAAPPRREGERKRPPLEIGEDGVRGARELGARFGGHASVHAASLALLIRAVTDALTERPVSNRVDRNTVVDTFCRESGMPPELIRDDLPLEPATVRASFEARIVGQPEAVQRMVDLVGMLKAGLTDPSRPLGSFLFVGPTGVGKTETAKALAEMLYGSARRLVRFDMSELAAPDAVHRFVGLGGQPGKLVSEIRRTPFCVLLLDEVEKAHPIAFDALLQVLGEARLSDGAGRTASFRNVVIIMTSNLGADTLRSNVGFGQGGTASWAEHFAGEARRFFRPELFNRIDHVVPFAALGAEAIEGIADRELARLAMREGLHHRGVRLVVPEAVRARMVERGTDARYGARPLKRTIERELAAPIARHLAGSRSLEPGTLETRLDGGELAFGYEKARAGDATSDEALRRARQAVSELRWFVDRCGLSPVLRDLRLDAARVARLLDNPRYLRGHEAMRHALSAIGTDQRLLQDFDALRAHAESLEDLAHEAVSAQHTGEAATLWREHGAVIERIKELGLALASREHERPNAALLVLRTRGTSAMLWHRLFEIYAELALRREWKVSSWVAADHPPLKTETDEPTVKVFVTLAPDLMPGGISRAFVNRCLAEVEAGDRVIALRFDGPHAGALLSAEGGAHELHWGGQTMRGIVRVERDLAMLDREHTQKQWEELESRFPSHLARVIHDGKNIVEDRALGLRAPTEPRLDRVYERFMLAHLYDGVFFPGAQRALARGLGR